MRRTLELSLKKENLVAEFHLIEFHEHHTRISCKLQDSAGFDFLSYSSKVDFEKVYLESMKDKA